MRFRQEHLHFTNHQVKGPWTAFYEFLANNIVILAFKDDREAQVQVKEHFRHIDFLAWKQVFLVGEDLLGQEE